MAYLDQHRVEHALCGLHVLLQIAVHEFEDEVQLPLALDTVLLSQATQTQAHEPAGFTNRGATSGDILSKFGCCDIELVLMVLPSCAAVVHSTTVAMSSCTIVFRSADPSGESNRTNAIIIERRGIVRSGRATSLRETIFPAKCGRTTCRHDKSRGAPRRNLRICEKTQRCCCSIYLGFAK